MSTSDEPAIPTFADSAPTRDKPPTARGARTREALVAAARRVFERDGFINSRLTDITAEASCSIGTFYTYFDSKEEIFTAVMQAAQDDMLHPGLAHVDEDLSNFVAIIDASNRAYVQAYKRNAKLMLLLEQMTTIDPAFRDLRLARSRAFARRNARWIARLQEAGYADPTLDPYVTARMISGMLARAAYQAFALEDDEWEEEAMIAAATRFWLVGLGIREAPPR